MVEIAFVPRPGGKTPLYEQLYRAIAQAVRRGELPVGAKLPGKRTLAGQLGVSVNTVDTAYQMLAAEGWLAAKPRSGFYIQQVAAPLAAPAAPPAAGAPAPAPAPKWEYDFSTGGVDVQLFPFRTWGRIQKELLYSRPGLLERGEAKGDIELRRAIAGHLRAARAVDCGPEQVVVGAGVEYLLGLLARMLGFSITALENPGYTRTRRILHNTGIRCVPVGVDERGLDPAALETAGARVVYLTPSHQFPTGAVLPVGRRAALLRWAAEAPGRYIIEDDYDSEFRFDMRPLPSLQGMAGREGPVIYLSTFSRSLAPSIRIAYMVLPLGLLEKFEAAFAGYSSTVSRFEQQTLAAYIEGGHFARQLARARNRYRARMLALTAALEGQFGPGRLEFAGRHTGLHFLLTLKDGPGEAAMVARAAQSGARLSGLSGYYLARREACPENTVVVGYGALADDRVERAAAALGDAWR